MSINQILVSIFLVYQPIYLSILIFLKNTLGYKINRKVISKFGAAPPPWRYLFNITSSLYGIFSVGLPLWILQYRSRGVLLCDFAVVSLLICGIGMVLVGIFPMDTKRTMHRIAACITFCGVFLTGLVFIPILKMITSYESVMILLSSATIIGTIILSIRYISKKYNHAFSEWTVAIFAISWNFLVSLIFLTNG